MSNQPRAATIKATKQSRLWSLSRQFFRQAMVTSSSKQSRNLEKSLREIPMFQDLDEQTCQSLARSFIKKTYQDGDFIITQGDIGQEFFVLFDGVCQVTKINDDGTEDTLAEIQKNNIFGELALIRDEPRAANIKAKGKVECLILGKKEFKELLGSKVDEMNDNFENSIIMKTEIFRNVSESKVRHMRKYFTTVLLTTGRMVYFDKNLLFIVVEGEVESSVGDRYVSGNLIGNLDDGTGSSGSIMCKSDDAKLIQIDRMQFNSDLQTEDVVEHEEEIDEQIVVSHRSAMFDLFQDLKLEDLVITGPLGKGTFGSVHKAHVISDQKKTSIALKCLDKRAVVEGNQQAYIKREISALQVCAHPLIVEYYGICWSPRKLFIRMEYIAGGEFWNYLHEDLPEDQKPEFAKGPYGGLTVNATALYIGNVVIALEHIHKKGYVFRDLKPENLMMASDGYLKLIDFGFAKQIPYVTTGGPQWRTFTLCGTPEYIPPEVVMTQGHDKSADFWSLGILLYEMLCGQTPFEGRNQQRTFEKIVQSSKFLSFPKNFDSHAKSLIRKFLHLNASLRLGALQSGFDGIKEHAFFITEGKLE